MVPTEEEISMIQDSMQQSPDVALGTAEQFLLTLSSISELEARLNLWSFKLEYDSLEKVGQSSFFLWRFNNIEPKTSCLMVIWSFAGDVVYVHFMTWLYRCEIRDYFPQFLKTI